MELDHVLIAVGDLAAAAHEFEVEHGLASIEGGRHPGWGTANRIVPLGKSYLELVAVVDQDEAARSDFGRWVAAMMFTMTWSRGSPAESKLERKPAEESRSKFVPSPKPTS
ncbi:MAG TPA: VOC family protein [Gaiellaceae bacterium]